MILFVMPVGILSFPTAQTEESGTQQDNPGVNEGADEKKPLEVGAVFTENVEGKKVYDGKGEVELIDCSLACANFIPA